MSDIKVSVWCLAYNHGKYIRKALDGFIMQKTNFAFEVFVHDDASTDNTSAIIKEYAEKYPQIIKPIYQKENQYSKGVEILHEIILPKMKGKYIASCEGDDFWIDEYKLQKQYDALEHNPDCCLSTHKVKCCNEDGSPNAREFPSSNLSLTKTRIVCKSELAEYIWEKGGYPFHTSCYFMRKDNLTTFLPIHWTDKARDIDVLLASLLGGNIFYFNEAMSIRRLDSVDGWNMRMKSGGDKARLDLTLGDIVRFIRFDKYSQYIYHSHIANNLYKRILFCIRLNKKKTEDVLSGFEIEFKEIQKVWSIKKRNRCYIYIYFNYLVKIASRMKNMLKRGMPNE